MAHIIIVADSASGASLRDQLVRCGHTVAVAAPGEVPGFAGVDACDVVLEVGIGSVAGDPVAASDGGRGAVPAAPRIQIPLDAVAAGVSPALRAGIQAAWLQARDSRLAASQDANDPTIDSDVHLVGHELRSPLTVIKTALEVMEGDLRTWHAEPADVEAQLRMLEIALRNVRRLHRAVEWSQMLLSGPRTEAPPLTAAGLTDVPAHLAPVAALQADGDAA
jgi:signal transduction histidine kinase